jgi:hypothetical protein
MGSSSIAAAAYEVCPTTLPEKHSAVLLQLAFCCSFYYGFDPNPRDKFDLTPGKVLPKNLNVSL